jgi:DNA polymerase I-like protein with 3'-5' exonuclease and polymerase domains
MKILVNYQVADKNYLNQLAYLLRERGLDAVSSSMPMTASELTSKAKLAGCTAILLCNEKTLQNIVADSKATLDKHRGSRFQLSVPVIVCNTLAHINTVDHGRWLLGKDLDKFKYIHTPPVKFNITYLTETKMFAEAEAWLMQSVLLAFDVETRLLNEPEDEDDIEAGDSIITCCSWSGVHLNGEIRTYVLPLVDMGNVDHWLTNADYAEAIMLMRRINASPIPKTMQNGMYDAVHSLRYHAEPNCWLLDTIGMAHSQYQSLPKTLDFLASYYLYDYIQWKDQAAAASKEKDNRKYWNYNGLDTFNTLRITIEWLRHAPAYAKKNYAMQFPLVYPFLYTAFEGILVDNEERIKLKNAAQQKLDAALSELRVMFADPNFNPGSWQQVEKYVYNVFGAVKPKIGKSKSCTDEKNLIAVGEQHPLLLRIVNPILSYRGEQKAIGTYFKFRQLNGRLLYSLDPFGTETARAACRSSSLWCGTQVQNIPGYAKSMLVADPGYVLFEIDNKQSEARCTAYLSEEEALIRALEAPGKDFYKQLGTLFFNIPYEEVTKEFRNNVLKKINHGVNYMMGAKTFIENITAKVLYETAEALGVKIVQVPRKNHPDEKTLMKFAGELLDVYHVPFPRIRQWYQNIRARIASTGMLVSVFGYTRYFFGDINKSHDMLRGAVAHEPQNLSVTILNKGFMKVYKEEVLPSKGAVRIKAQIHDSIFGQVREDLADYYIPRIEKHCENPVVIHGRTLLIPTDMKTGRRWIDLKD